MYGWKGEVVCEPVLFEICKAHGRKGGEEGRAGVYAVIVNRIPYHLTRPFNMMCLFYLPKLLDRVVIADDAFAAVVALWAPV